MTEADLVSALEAALDHGDPRMVAGALGTMARARGMSRVARDAGLNRESLYRALAPEGNPELATFLRVIRAMGIHLHATMEPVVPEPSGLGLPERGNLY
jgi:probable addiction module antidote protein